MVDSRQKGTRAENDAKDKLREYTNLNWQRTPLSGALSAVHQMKGDLYIPKFNLKYCVEVKHYAEDQVSTKLLTGKSPMFNTWWQQAVRQATETETIPLLLFKHDRSKWFVAYSEYWNGVYMGIENPVSANNNKVEVRAIKYYNAPYRIEILLLQDWINYREIEWV